MKILRVNRLALLTSAFTALVASCGLGSDGLTREAVHAELRKQGFVVESVLESQSLVCLLRDGVANIVNIQRRDGLAEVTTNSLNEEDIPGWGTIVVWDSDEARVTYFSTREDDQVNVALSEILGGPVASGGSDVTGGTAPSPAATCDEALQNL